MGKTHLLQAIGNYMRKNSNSKIIYVTTKNFLVELIRSKRNNTISAFNEKYLSVDVLLMDDIQFLPGPCMSQREIFYIFENLYNTRKQMVFTCGRPVWEIEKITEWLFRPFERWLAVDMQPLN
jgi:chromosomal replication initiator protein